MLEKFISSISNIQIVGKFTNSFKAEEIALMENIDVVFLETELPRISGIILAKLLKEYNDNIDIVFITNFKEYALDACYLQALDYIIKPITKDRLKNTMKRIVALNHIIK